MRNKDLIFGVMENVEDSCDSIREALQKDDWAGTMAYCEELQRQTDVMKEIAIIESLRMYK